MGSVLKSQWMVNGVRMSNLPDHLVHHILSFLSMQDIALLCIVSKKYRGLCISIPSLNLDANPYKNQPAKRERFINFLDRFIALRKGVETRRISVNWYFTNIDSDELYRFLTLLHGAMSSKVESLALNIKLLEGGAFVLPHYMIHLESLLDLEMNMRGGCLRFPFSYDICKIQSLRLKNITVGEGTLGEWVSSCCMYLKKLSLVNVRGIKNISIERSTLQHLKITLSKSSEVCNISVSSEMLKSFILRWTFDTFIGKTLSIFAPNLEKLIWSGNLVSSYSLGELKHLWHALFFLKPAPLVEGNGFQNLSELLLTTCPIQYLMLHDECLEVLFKQGCLSTARLCNLQELCIFKTSLSDDLVPAIACLLNATPNLRSLLLKCITSLGEKKLEDSLAPKAYGYTIEYWESQNLMFVQHVEKVTIHLHENGKNELEFVKYLLRNAKHLQMMKILDSSIFSSKTRREIIEYERASAADVAFL